MGDLRSALGRVRLPLIIAGVVVAAFLLAPLLVILPAAFANGRYLRFPPPGVSTMWFHEVLSDGEWRAAFLRSLGVASVAAGLATVAGALGALGLRRLTRGVRELRTMFMAPLVLPQLILALGLYLAFGGLTGGVDLRVLALGQATIAVPVVLVTVSAGLAKVPPNLTRAAASLGCRWPWVVLRVELPLVRRSVVAGGILAFALCFDEAVLAYFLSPPGQETLPTRIWLAASESASPAIAAASTLVIGIAMGLFGLVTFLLRSGAAREP